MINTMEINPDELAGLDLFQNCRLCLAKEKVSVDIFSDGAEVRLLYYKIISCLPVQVTQEDDKLPKKICMTCNEKVDTFYQFWTLTAKTQKTLIDWAQQKDVITTKIKTENVPPGEMSFKQETIDYSDDNDNDDHYDDDNSDDDVEPSAIVKVCEETDEAGTSATAHIKSVVKKENIPYDHNVTNETFDKETLLDLDGKSERTCLNCGVVTESIRELRAHAGTCKKQKSERLECIICNKSLSVKSMRRHMRKHSKGKATFEEKSFECALCQRIFRKKSVLEDHMLKHMNIKLRCDMCGSQYGNKYRLQRHIRQFHQLQADGTSNMFPCTLCPKVFRARKSLEDHQHVHTGMKYLCHFCERPFCLKSSLTLHIKTKHKTSEGGGEPDSKPFQCETCGKSYVYKHAMLYHYKVEHADGKLTCNLCGKRLFKRESLVIHMNTHLGVKPFCCEFCGKFFSTKKYLKVHGRSHTGETPHVCHVCSKGFKQRSSLTFHYKSNHPGVPPSSLA